MTGRAWTGLRREGHHGRGNGKTKQTLTNRLAFLSPSCSLTVGVSCLKLLSLGCYHSKTVFKIYSEIKYFCLYVKLPFLKRQSGSTRHRISYSVMLVNKSQTYFKYLGEVKFKVKNYSYL